MSFYYTDERTDKLKTWELCLKTMISDDIRKRYGLESGDFIDYKMGTGDNAANPNILKLFKDFIQTEQDISYTINNTYGGFNNMLANASDGLANIYRNSMDSYNVSKALWENFKDGNGLITSIKDTITGGSSKNMLKGSDGKGILENIDNNYMRGTSLTAKRFLNNYKQIYNGSDITIGTLNVTARIFAPEDYLKFTRVLRLLLPVEQYFYNNIVYDVDNNNNNQIEDVGQLLYKRPGKYTSSDDELCTSFNITKLEKSSGYILRIGNKEYKNLIILEMKIECSHIKTVGYVVDSTNNKLKIVKYPAMTTVSMSFMPSDPIVIYDIVTDIQKACSYIEPTNTNTQEVSQ